MKKNKQKISKIEMSEAFGITLGVATSLFFNSLMVFIIYLSNVFSAFIVFGVCSLICSVIMSYFCFRIGKTYKK